MTRQSDRLSTPTPQSRPEAPAGSLGTRRPALGARALAHLRIARPANAATAAVGVLAGIALATYHTWPSALGFAVSTGARLEIWIAAPLAAAAITAAGNITNDIVDVHVDRTAHPQRPLPQGLVTSAAAAWQAAFLVFLGLAAAFLAGGAALLAFAAANTGLLALYEGYAKRRGLPGNLLVAILVGSTVLFGGYAWSGRPGAEAALPLAVMAALSNLAREIVKDIEDARHDAASRATLPLTLGRTGASALATAALGGAVAYALVDAAMQGTVPVSYLLVPVALFALGAGSAWRWPSLGQRTMKVAMAAALAAYLAPGIVRTL